MTTAAAMEISLARKVLAMGFAPAVEAGFSPWAALDAVQADNAKQRDARASDPARRALLWIGKIVNDGKLGRITEIDGMRVKLAGYLGPRSAHIDDLTEWSFRAGD